MHNVGAAFSFLASASGWQRWMFIGLAGIVSIGITIWLLRLPRNANSLLAAGLALVLGGAVGNVIDRIRLGYVIDFIHFHWDRAYFPAFMWRIHRSRSARLACYWMPCSRQNGRHDAYLIG